MSGYVCVCVCVYCKRSGSVFYIQINIKLDEVAGVMI